MKTLVWKVIFFSVIVVQGVVTVEVERFSSPSISKAIGENATIVWKIKGIQASSVDILTITIMKGEPSPANSVLNLNVHNADSVPDSTVGSKSVHKELESRSTANYTYTGLSSDGQETARVSFTINNLILDDEGSYLLVARAKSSPTIISVNFGPEKCGSGLETKYTVNPGDELMISSGFCGKPQPNVTCSLNGTLVNTVDITKISQYNYSYTARIPKLEPCDRKEMNCTVAGYGKAYNESTTVIALGRKKVSDGACAGHIIGFEIGVILICVFICVYVVKWKATKETCRLTGFIIAVVVGLALVIALSVSYAGLRKSDGNDNCGKGSMSGCDKAFIVFGVIDIVALIIVVVITVKVLKDSRSKTTDQPIVSGETTHLNPPNSLDGTVKKPGGATETSGQANNQNV